MIERTQDLLEWFSLPTDGTYFEETVLRDVQVGFSVQRHYSADSRFYSPKDSDGQPTVTCIVHVVLDIEKEDEGRIPIRVSANMYDRYLTGDKFQRDFEDPACPSQDELEKSRQSVQPLGFTLDDQFEFDSSRCVIVSRTGAELDGVQFLDWVFSRHERTTRISALGLRARVRFREWVLKTRILIGRRVVEALLWVIRTFWGRRHRHGDGWLLQPDKMFRDSDFEFEKEDTLSFLGLEVPRRVALSFSAVVLLLSVVSILFSISCPWYESVRGDPLGLAALVIVGFATWDVVVLAVLRSLCRVAARLYLI